MEERKDYEVIAVGSDDFCDIISSSSFDIAIVEIIPIRKEVGLEIIEKLNKENAPTKVIIVSGMPETMAVEIISQSKLKIRRYMYLNLENFVEELLAEIAEIAEATTKG